MKTFRLFLVGVFILLSVAVVPVRAQAAGESVGYLPLLPHVDANMPIRFQSQQALRRIMPRLLALQKSGVISAFEPELQKGFVRITYSNAAGLSALGGAQVYAKAQDAMVSIPKSQGLLQSVANSGPKAAVVGPIFLFEIYHSCFEMDQLGANSHIVVGLHNKAGRVVSAYEGDADSSGYLSDCFTEGSIWDVIPGYKITIKVYDDSSFTTRLGTYKVFAPSISYTGFNKNKSIVQGTGPANKFYNIGWFHVNLDAGNTVTILNKNGQVSASGKWARGFGTIKFRGGDSFGMFLQKSSRFTFFTAEDIPYIYCQLDSNYCEITGRPFGLATLSILHNGTTFKFAGKFDDDGSFPVTLEANGIPIILKKGDQISGTSVPVYSLPDLTIEYDISTDVMSGKAPPNKYFELWVNQSCFCSWYFIWGHSNSAGIYSGDFSSQVDILPNQAANMEVFYVARATGNITDYYKTLGP